MLEFIHLLKQRYQIIFSGLIKEHVLSAVYQERIEQITLAEAFFHKTEIVDGQPSMPVNIVIIGPTQVGKSSIVNLILGETAADVSPLAGYTIHPQGFGCGLSAKANDWLNEYFCDYKQLQQQQMDKTQQRCFSYNDSASCGVSDCIIWDTPDFDSIDSNGYREGLLKAIALADIVVLVLSKEKYADQSVWTMMSLLQTMQQPTLVVINKLIESAQSVILNSLQEKWRQARSDKVAVCIPLLYNKAGFKEQERLAVNTSIEQLRQHIKREKYAVYQQQFLLQYWQAWTEPVVAELTARQDWVGLIEDSMEQALVVYKRDYLDHPHHYETFQNALVELLTLLEIPGLSTVMAKTRRVLTWPVRKIFNLTGSAASGLSESSQEIVLLNQISEHLLIQLSDRLLDKIDQESDRVQWWKDLNVILRRQRAVILQQFRKSALKYHDDFQQQVDTTAQRLYNKLKDQPLTLNSLRATRITTDAAVVALALKTGGIGLHDLVITPAMLSVTSFLAESAIGSYVHKLEAELKQRQQQTVRQTLFQAVLHSALVQLPEMMADSRHFNIPPLQFSHAEQAVTGKPNGLRIL